MVQFKISVENREVQLKMDRLIRKTPQLSRRILGRLSEAVIAQSIKNYLSGTPLKRRTGTLAKSLNHKMLNDWRAQVGTNLTYAAIHEFGGVIEPKNSPYLAFRTDDGWVRTRKVVMPKRSYLAPAISDVFNSAEASRISDETIEEWLTQEWKR